MCCAELVSPNSRLRRTHQARGQREPAPIAADSAFNGGYVRRRSRREARRRGGEEAHTGAARSTTHRCLVPVRKSEHAQAARRSDAIPRLGHSAGDPRRSGFQRSNGGSAREANGERAGSCASARCSRCARMRSINAGPSILAITRSCPPQRRQRSMSIPSSGTNGREHAL